jgi:hypothetical protein
MLVAPVMDGDTLYGVLQVINNRSDQPFGKLEEDGARQLCKTLGIAIRQRMQKTDDGQRRKATKYDGLVTEGVLSQDELQQCIQQAREEGKSVEHILMAAFTSAPPRSANRWPSSSVWAMSHSIRPHPLRNAARPAQARLH